MLRHQKYHMTLFLAVHLVGPLVSSIKSLGSRTFVSIYERNIAGYNVQQLFDEVATSIVPASIRSGRHYIDGDVVACSFKLCRVMFGSPIGGPCDGHHKDN